MQAAASAQSSTSCSSMPSRCTSESKRPPSSFCRFRTTSAAISRLKRAITLVNRLSLTTVVYSSGPVTPWMWKVRAIPSSGLGSRQKPRSAHIRAVSTRISTPSRSMKSVVAGGAHVLAQGERDVGVDVVLSGAGGVVRRGLLAVDRPPGKQRTALGQVLRAATGGVEHVVAEPQRAPRHLRRGVGQERQDVDLGVPEVVAAVPGTADALRRDAGLLGPGGGLGQLEEVPAHCLLDRRLTDDLDVGACPVPVQPGALIGELLLDALLGGAIERPPAAVDQLAHRHPARRVVGGHLDDLDRLSDLGVHPVDHLAGVLVGGDQLLIGVLRVSIEWSTPTARVIFEL